MIFLLEKFEIKAQNAYQSTFVTFVFSTFSKAYETVVYDFNKTIKNNEKKGIHAYKQINPIYKDEDEFCLCQIEWDNSNITTWKISKDEIHTDKLNTI